MGLGPDHRADPGGDIRAARRRYCTRRTSTEAVEIANGVRYGLVTSVHGRDLDRLLAAAAELDTGLIKINAPTSGVDFYAPFGGEKESSFGPREQGQEALAFYTSARTVTVAPHGGLSSRARISPRGRPTDRGCA